MGNAPAVTLDMSKAQPIAQAQPVTLDMTKAQPINPTPLDVLSRTNQNMALAMSGQSAQMRPDDQAQFESGRTAGTIAAAGTLATGALSAAGAALTAPTVGTQTVGTGILDAAGEEIKREVLKYGPSLGKQAASTAVKWVANNPVSAALGYHLARKLGVPLPKILDVLGAMSETPTP
jgi:hypothetical protein